MFEHRYFKLCSNYLIQYYKVSLISQTIFKNRLKNDQLK